jgi:8-oxo-dGTP pyrophosphatase MutT (NUDIX family)
MMRKALCQQSTSSLAMQPSTSLLLQNAAPRIVSILSSFKENGTHEGTEHLLVEDTDAHTSSSSSSSYQPPMATTVKEEDLKQWQTPHLPILTNRQLEMSLLEIERRKKLKEKQKTTLRRDDDQSTSTTTTHSNNNNTRNNKEAAILIPLCSVQGIPSILFTRRSATLSNHASQISFPGGYYDELLDGGNNDDDDRLVNTALRETQEELCYNDNNINNNNTVRQLPTSSSSFITILGRTQPVPSMQGRKVTPIIAMINYDLPPHSSVEFTRIFPGNPDEVDWIFTIPIRDLMEGETSEPLERWSTSYSNNNSHDEGSKNGKQMKKRRGRGGEVMGPAYRIPECKKKREGDKIWGLTAIVLRPLLRKVFGPVFCGEEDVVGSNAKL